MATFAVPLVEENATGWGPTDVPEALKNVPFAPFSKYDKLGKASDWTNTSYPRVNLGRHQVAANVFNFAIDNEESNFHLVDSRPTRSKNFGQRRPQQQYQKRGDQREEYGRPGQSNAPQGQGQQRGKQQQQRGRQPHWRDQRNQVTYSASVDIRPEWTVLEQIHFPLLTKLALKVAEPEDIIQCGVLEFYDKAIDRVSPKTALPLAKTSRAFRSVTSSDDPILKKLAAEGKARIFFTDSILTALMCTTRSVYSWDIVITRKGNQMWFDKRPDSQVDRETVNETAPEPIPEDETVNGVHQLALEATAIRQNFSQQALDRSHTLDLGNPNPFKQAWKNKNTKLRKPELKTVQLPGERVGQYARIDPLCLLSEDSLLMIEGSNEELASIGYRYRKWNLGEDIDVVVRCELDGVINHRGEDMLLALRTFNQSTTGPTDMDWKRKLERQSAAVLAIEAKNNSNKVARWTLAAMLAGADMMKVGFTTRVSPKDNHNHELLVTQMQKPKDLAGQLNINMDNCWAIVRSIVDLCFKLEKDNYLLMKDPNKQLLYLYEIPNNAFATQYVDDLDDDSNALPMGSTAVDAELTIE